MTTAPGGPRTQISKYPRFVTGASANIQLMDFQSAQTDNRKVAQRIEQLTDAAHDISMSEPVVTTDPAVLKKLGFIQSNHKLYAKTPVIAQTGNFPHGIPEEMLDSDYWKNVLTDQERQEAMNQSIMRHLIPFGVNQANFRKTEGPSKSAPQEGLDIIIYGPATSNFFTGTVLPPMTEVALVPMPKQRPGRSGLVKYMSEGSERYPFTVRPLSVKTVVDNLRNDLASYSKRILEKPNGAGVAASVFGQAINPSGRDGALLEADKNAATFLAGVLAIAAVFIEERDAADAGNDAAVAAEARLAAAEKFASFVQDNDKMAKVLRAVTGRLCGTVGPTKVVSGDSARRTKYATLTRSALGLTIGAVQDTAAVNNRRFAKILQHVPGSASFASSASGAFDYDYLVG